MKKIVAVGTFTVVAFASLCAVAGAVDGVWLKGTTDKDPLSYKAGEEAVFTVEPVDVDGVVPEGQYMYKWERSDDYGNFQNGTVPFDGKPFVYRTTLDKPGFVRLYVNIIGPDGYSMFMQTYNVYNVFLTLSLVGWAGIARVVRSEAMRLKSSAYVSAARLIGVPGYRIILRHILPNCIPTLIVLFTLGVPSSILTESSLSFLGLGIQPPDTSWGQMINLGRQYLYNAPWLSFAPCAAIMLIVLAFNFLGDGLRDVLDPHLQGKN